MQICIVHLAEDTCPLPPSVDGGRLDDELDFRDGHFAFLDFLCTLLILDFFVCQITFARDAKRPLIGYKAVILALHRHTFRVQFGGGGALVC